MDTALTPSATPLNISINEEMMVDSSGRLSSLSHHSSSRVGTPMPSILSHHQMQSMMNMQHHQQHHLMSQSLNQSYCPSPSPSPSPFLNMNMSQHHASSLINPSLYAGSFGSSMTAAANYNSYLAHLSRMNQLSLSQSSLVSHNHLPFTSPLSSFTTLLPSAPPNEAALLQAYSYNSLVSPGASPATPITPGFNGSFWPSLSSQAYSSHPSLHQIGNSGSATSSFNSNFMSLFSPSLSSSSLSSLSPVQATTASELTLSGHSYGHVSSISASHQQHSPMSSAFYPRIHSLPSPYASSPSAFMSPGSLPPILSPVPTLSVSTAELMQSHSHSKKQSMPSPLLRTCHSTLPMSSPSSITRVSKATTPTVPISGQSNKEYHKKTHQRTSRPIKHEPGKLNEDIILKSDSKEQINKMSTNINKIIINDDPKKDSVTEISTKKDVIKNTNAVLNEKSNESLKLTQELSLNLDSSSSVSSPMSLQPLTIDVNTSGSVTSASTSPSSCSLSSISPAKAQTDAMTILMSSPCSISPRRSRNKSGNREQPLMRLEKTIENVAKIAAERQKKKNQSAEATSISLDQKDSDICDKEEAKVEEGKVDLSLHSKRNKVEGSSSGLKVAGICESSLDDKEDKDKVKCDKTSLPSMKESFKDIDVEVPEDVKKKKKSLKHNRDSLLLLKDNHDEDGHHKDGHHKDGHHKDGHHKDGHHKDGHKDGHDGASNRKESERRNNLKNLKNLKKNKKQSSIYEEDNMKEESHSQSEVSLKQLKSYRKNVERNEGKSKCEKSQSLRHSSLSSSSSTSPSIEHVNPSSKRTNATTNAIVIPHGSKNKPIGNANLIEDETRICNSEIESQGKSQALSQSLQSKPQAISIPKPPKSEMMKPSSGGHKGIDSHSRTHSVRKHPHSAIPVGIAIAQQRISNNNSESPNSNSNNSNSNASNISITNGSTSLTHQVTHLGIGQAQLKPIVPTLQLTTGCANLGMPTMVNQSPILISTDSPPGSAIGTASLWIKPTNGNNQQVHQVQISHQQQQQQQAAAINQQPAFQLARDSMTGQFYLIRNQSPIATASALVTPTSMSMNMNGNTNNNVNAKPSVNATHSHSHSHSLPPSPLVRNTGAPNEGKHGLRYSSSSPTLGATILTIPNIGHHHHQAGRQQFFTNMHQQQAHLSIPTSNSSSTLILNANHSQSSQNHVSNQRHSFSNSIQHQHLQMQISPHQQSLINANPAAMAISQTNTGSSHKVHDNLGKRDAHGHSIGYRSEIGTQACISSDDENVDMNMKTTSTQVDMDVIHSSEEDEDNEGRKHKALCSNNVNSNIKMAGKAANTSLRFEEFENENDDESRDSVHLTICERDDNMIDLNAPTLPVKSAPVMEFIDHHGLDLLVDSIEEFAENARLEEQQSRATSRAASPLPSSIDGLQLLSVLAEQRSREEREAGPSSPPRRHSTESGLTIDQSCLPMKKRARSESCFTSTAVATISEEDIEMRDKSMISPYKKIKSTMQSSGSQTMTVERPSPYKQPISIPKLKIIKKKSSKDGFIATSSESLKEKKHFKLLKKMDKNKCPSPTNESANYEKPAKSNQSLSQVVEDPFAFVIETSSATNKHGDKVTDSNVFRIRKKEKHESFDVENKKHSREVEETSSESRKKSKKKRKEKDKERHERNKLKKKQHLNVGNSEANESKEPKEKIEEHKTTNSDESIDKRSVNAHKAFEFDEERMKLLDQTIDEIIASNTPIERKDEENDDNSSSKDKDDEKSLNSSSNSSSVTEKVTEHKDESKTDTNNTKEVSEEGSSAPKTKPVKSPRKKDKLERLKEHLIIDMSMPASTLSCSKTNTIETSLSSSNATSTCTSSSVSPSNSSYSLSEICESLESTVEPTINMSLRLNEKDLDTPKMNVIMLVDSLLYVGEIVPIQPPDIYGILLIGERQHRPHIYSQEEMLLEAIREVKPSRVEQLSVGQRVCAYWSTQYRHLYPGFIRSSTPHPTLVFVEFDDGDSGRIPVSDIRLLPQDYPLMKISANPMDILDGNMRIGRSRSARCRSDSTANESESKSSLNAKTSSFSFTSPERDSNNSVLIPTCLSATSFYKSQLPSPLKASSVTSSNSDAIINGSNPFNPKAHIFISSYKPLSSSSPTKGTDKAIDKKPNDVSKVNSKRCKKKMRAKDEPLRGDKVLKNRHHRHHHHHVHKHQHTHTHRHHSSLSLKTCHRHRDTSSSRRCSKHKNKNRSEKQSSLESKEEASLRLKRSRRQLVMTMKSTNKSGSNIEHSISRSSKSTRTTATKSGSNDPTQKITSKSGAQKHDKRKLDELDLKTHQDNHIKSDSHKSLHKREAAENAIKKFKSQSNSNSTNRLDFNSNSTNKSNSNEEKKSKIAAFLPEKRHLWHWLGKCVKRTGNKGSRTRKLFYKQIERGKGEIIGVGDSAIFLSTGRPHLPYIGLIDSMWQTGSGTMMVKVSWFYHPEETKGSPVPLVDKRGALFKSSHYDVNDVQTISHKCHVMSWVDYQVYKKKRDINGEQTVDDPPNVYYLAAKYDAMTGDVEMEPHVPLKRAVVD